MQITRITSFQTNIRTNRIQSSSKKAQNGYPVFNAGWPDDDYKNYLRNLLIKKTSENEPITDNYKKGLVSLSKLEDFTISEYQKLTKEEINNINEVVNDHIYNNKQWLFYDKAFNKDINYHEIIANGIKNGLNQVFGEGNYIVIPIGRSLSSIGKCLGYKIGEDNVKLLPMSNAVRFLKPEKCEDEDFDALSEYLDSIGLSKKEIETSGKQYIFMDYCATGLSLLGAEKLLTSDKMYGNLENIKFVNIVSFLKQLKLEPSKDEFNPGINNFADDLDRMFCHSRFKPYSQVKECYRLSDTKNSVMKPEDYKFDARVFLFKLLDNEMNKSS